MALESLGIGHVMENAFYDKRASGRHRLKLQHRLSPRNLDALRKELGSDYRVEPWGNYTVVADACVRLHSVPPPIIGAGRAFGAGRGGGRRGSVVRR